MRVRRRVSAYLARVVGALADFEDQLLFEDGFFAREELFEEQISNLRREFDQNKRAQVLFARSDAVGLLIAQLVATPSSAASADLHSRRQQQFVFAASVLLTSTTSLTTLHAHPSLIQRLWAFVERPAPLHPVQLQYWCRAAGSLLLGPPPAAADGSKGVPIEASALARLLPRLLTHAYSEAVCVLVKCVLGLPCQAVGAQAAHAPPSAMLPMHTALSGENAALLRQCVARVLAADESADNCAELLCTLCEALPLRSDALELSKVFVPALTPALGQLLDAALSPSAAPPPASHGGVGGGARAALGALRITAAALQMEERCASLSDEQMAMLPTALLSEGMSPGCSARPFAKLLAPRLGALCERLLHSRSLVQLKVAELLATVLTTAPPSLHKPIRDAKLLEAAVGLYLCRDVNGGGQQDFLRVLLLRALRAALQLPAPELHAALVANAEVSRAMLRALRPFTGRHTCKAPAREHVCLLYTELAKASEAHASVKELLGRNTEGWAALGRAITNPGMEVASSPPASSPTPSLPSPEVYASPAELLDLEEDSFEAELQAERRGWLGNADDDANDDDADDGVGVDAENINPNSPDISANSPPAVSKRSHSGRLLAPAPPTSPQPSAVVPPPMADECATPPSRSHGLSSHGLHVAVGEPSTPPAAGSAAARGSGCQAAIRLGGGAEAPVHPGTPRPEAAQPGAKHSFVHPGTPTPGSPYRHPGTPTPSYQGHAPAAPSAGSHVGTPRPDKSLAPPHVGTPRPDEGVAASPGSTAAYANFVDGDSLRSSEDFSRDTPQPKVTRRAYLHRRAKAESPFGNIGDSPSSSPLPSPIAAALGIPSLAHVAGDGTGLQPSSPVASPSRASFAEASAPLLASKGSAHAAVALPASLADADDEALDQEDASVAQLRSSVRTLCF